MKKAQGKIFVIDNSATKEACRAAIDAIKLDEKLYVEIKPYHGKRSLAQNALLWLWIEVISDHTGYTKEEVHDMICHLFLGYSHIEINGVIIEKLITTSRLNTKEFTELLNEIDRWAASEIGLSLPHPDDLYWDAIGATR